MRDQEILLGITGGIAAYKSADLCSKLVQSGARVTAVMTRSAEKFIGPTTFAALTNRPVYQDMFRPVEHHLGEHIGLARRADLYVIAPCTADCIARLAHGLADDLVSILALSVSCPILIAPAMNNEMWTKPAVQRNVEQLRNDGLHLVGPAEGWLSCQSVGPGRMAEPVEIVQVVEGLLAPE